MPSLEATVAAIVCRPLPGDPERIILILPETSFDTCLLITPKVSSTGQFFNGCMGIRIIALPTSKGSSEFLPISQSHIMGSMVYSKGSPGVISFS